MALKRSSLLIVAASVAALSWLAPMLASSADGVPAKRIFSKVGTWKTHKIEVDKNTVTLVRDKDGDPLAGAVFRITMTKAVPTGDGKEVHSFVNSIIAVCGYDGLLMVNSKAYDAAGKLLSELNDMQQYRDAKQESTPTTEIYKFLCKDVTKKAPPVRGNNYA